MHAHIWIITFLIIMTIQTLDVRLHQLRSGDIVNMCYFDISSVYNSSQLINRMTNTARLSLQASQKKVLGKS